MEPSMEFKKDGYVYILKSNKKQYKCVNCSSTFTIDLYNTRSGHSGKCRNSKSAKKTVKKTADIMQKIQILPSPIKKKLSIGDPVRVPTKHFIKDITPPMSMYDYDGSIEESSDKQSHHEIEFDSNPEPKPDPMTVIKIDIQNRMKVIEERQKMKKRILDDERKKKNSKEKKTFKLKKI